MKGTALSERTFVDIYNHSLSQSPSSPPPRDHVDICAYEDGG